MTWVAGFLNDGAFCDAHERQLRKFPGGFWYHAKILTKSSRHGFFSTSLTLASAQCRGLQGLGLLGRKLLVALAPNVVILQCETGVSRTIAVHHRLGKLED